MSEIAELKKKLEESPDSLVFISLADACRKNGDLDEALKVCKKGLEKHPSNASARIVLGRIYVDQSKTAEAIQEFEKILELDPENMMAHSLLGSVYIKKGDYQAAIDEYQKILSLNPDDEEIQAFLKKAIEQAASAQKPGAETKSKPVTEEKKTATSTSTASLTMADLYLKQDHVDKAIEVYEELLSQDPQNQVVRQKLSEANRKKQGTAPSPEATKPAPAKPVEKKEPGPKKHDGDGKEDDLKFTSDFVLELMEGGSKTKSVPEKKPAASDPVPTPKVEPVAKVESPVKPKVEEPVPEPPQKEVAASTFSSEQTTTIKGALSELGRVDGILKCYLMGSDGIVVVSLGESSNNDSNKQAAAIFKDTQASVAKLHQGILKQVLVTAESGHVLLMSCLGQVLVVLANGQVNLGLLKVALDSATRKFEKIA